MDLDSLFQMDMDLDFISHRFGFDLVSIFQMKICFDSSWNVPTSQISYSCNYCIYHFKTKIILIPHTMSMYLQSLPLSFKNFCLDSSQNVPSGRKHYSCNHCNDHIKTKLVLIHHKMSCCVVFTTVFTREMKMTSSHEYL